MAKRSLPDAYPPYNNLTLNPDQQRLLAQGLIQIKRMPKRDYVVRTRDKLSMAKVLNRAIQDHIDNNGYKPSATWLYAATEKQCLVDFGTTYSMASLESLISQYKHGPKAQRANRRTKKGRRRVNIPAAKPAVTTPGVTVTANKGPGLVPSDATQSQITKLLKDAGVVSKPANPVTTAASVTLYKPSPMPWEFKLHEEKACYALRQAKKGRTVGFVGPAGCGKSIIMQGIIRLLNSERGWKGADLWTAANKGVEAIDIQSGQRDLVIENGASKTVSSDSIYKIAAQNGLACGMDEINVLKGDVAYAFYPFLDGINSSYITDKGEMVTVQEGFAFLFTTNDLTGDNIDKYAGLNDVNEALRDRAIVVDVTYMKAGQEARWLHEETSVDKQFANKVAQFAEILRNSTKYEGDVSHRLTKRICEQVHEGERLIDVVRYCVTNRAPQHEHDTITQALEHAGIV